MKYTKVSEAEDGAIGKVIRCGVAHVPGTRMIPADAVISIMEPAEVFYPVTNGANTLYVPDTTPVEVLRGLNSMMLHEAPTPSTIEFLAGFDTIPAGTVAVFEKQASVREYTFRSEDGPFTLPRTAGGIPVSILRTVGMGATPYANRKLSAVTMATCGSTVRFQGFHAAGKADSNPVVMLEGVVGLPLVTRLVRYHPAETHISGDTWLQLK